jgi:lipid A 3-O-deacylase
VTRFALIAFMAFSSPAMAGEPQWFAAFGRGAESADTDILRVGYRHPLNDERWWAPSRAQFGGSLWRVPDIRGTTRRFDLNVTAIWQKERPWGYLEAGFGGYLLSKTINTDETRVPSAFEFGSHIGIGFKVGPGALGVGLQHLSNAGIKQPNGGINLVLLQYTVSTKRR